MTILAFGCSVTHGADIAGTGNSNANIPFSYPALVAHYLGVDFVNHAFCGNSNENIFHTALDIISTCNSITAVIVGWTSVEREVWQCNGRTWQIIPSWCATSKNVWEPFTQHISPPPRGPLRAVIPYRCADDLEYIKVLDMLYDAITKYKFDFAAYTRKRDNYISALRAFCNTNNIRLIETCWADDISGTVNLGAIGDWYPAMRRHPTAAEQKLFAEKIIDHYKL